MATLSDDGITTRPIECVEDLQNFSPEVRQQVAECFQKADSLSILVTGKTGSGKSTLIDGLLGFDVDAASRRLVPCTSYVEEYTTEMNGVRLRLWDTPGFQDGTANQEEYLRQIERTCFERDLTLFCIKCGGETRFVNGDDNPDVVAMKKLTAKFGMGFWKNTVIVLTFSNWISSTDRNWKKYSPKKKKEVFRSKIQQWKGQIQCILRDQLQVQDDIPIVPAGLVDELHLPDTDYWLTVLFRKCLIACKSNVAQAALLRIIDPRISCNADSKNSIFYPVLIGMGVGGALVGGGAGLGGAALLKAGGAGFALGGVAGAVVGVLAALTLAYFLIPTKGKDKTD